MLSLRQKICSHKTRVSILIRNYQDLRQDLIAFLTILGL